MKLHLRFRTNLYLKLFLFLLVILIFPAEAFSQGKSLDVGLRFQKAINLYYENGLIIQYSDERLLDERLYIGLSYVTSRLGSAMDSNALKQDNYLLLGTYIFRPKRYLQPFIRLNTGYFFADYEEEFFDDLINTSFLLSPEAGVSLRTNSPFKVAASLGYNLITGNGIDGPGTLFPVFVQTSITWDLFHTNSEQ